jgi:putative transposase
MPKALVAADPHAYWRDEEVIRQYIRNQEKEDARLEQMNLWR